MRSANSPKTANQTGLIVSWLERLTVLVPILLEVTFWLD